MNRPSKYHQEHERQHVTFGSHLNALESHANVFGDQEKINTIHEVREGIKLAGFSINTIGHLNNASSGTSGKVALGQYYDNKISLAGLNQLEDLERGGKTRERVKLVLMHEKNHKESHNAEGYFKVVHLLDTYFGEGAAFAVEEGMASDGLTDGFDAYDAERVKSFQIAGQLGISTKALYRIKKEGDYKKLVSLILKSMNPESGISINKKEMTA